MVGMDIKRMHQEAGLLHTRSKRNFTGITSNYPGQQDDSDQDQHGPDFSDGDDHDPLDFTQLSARLIEGAASANIDRDVGDDDDELPASAPPLRITIPPFEFSGSI